MRVSVFVLAVLSVFAILAYTIWLESAIVAEAYEIRRLRGEEAEMRNQIKIRQADLAKRTRATALEETAVRMGMVPMQRNVAVAVIVPEIKPEARGAD